MEWLGLLDEDFVTDLGNLQEEHDEPMTEEQTPVSDIEDLIEHHGRRLDVDEDFDDTAEEIVFGSRQAYSFNSPFPIKLRDGRVTKCASVAAKYLLGVMRNPRNIPDKIMERYRRYFDNWMQYMESLSRFSVILKRSSARTRRRV